VPVAALAITFGLKFKISMHAVVAAGATVMLRAWGSAEAYTPCWRAFSVDLNGGCEPYSEFQSG
jgi:hypothetical protein